KMRFAKKMDCRVKPGNDGGETVPGIEVYSNRNRVSLSVKESERAPVSTRRGTLSIALRVRERGITGQSQRTVDGVPQGSRQVAPRVICQAWLDRCRKAADQGQTFHTEGKKPPRQGVDVFAGLPQQLEGDAIATRGMFHHDRRQSCKIPGQCSGHP